MNVNRFPNISDYENNIVNGLLICRNCETPVAEKRRHYCSSACMNEFMRNHTWSWVREDVLRRDGYRCSICEARKPKSKLDVDHIIPVRKGIDPYDKNNLRLLCKECHKAKTALDREAKL
ncbi:HNH endonuclease [Candidatus Woesearchaeota archaeon]|nr:HNH endonuclease [Candidatus Woesearchaeota archaeon]